MSCRTEADYLAAGEIPPLDSESRKRVCIDEDGSQIPIKVFFSKIYKKRTFVDRENILKKSSHRNDIEN